MYPNIPSECGEINERQNLKLCSKIEQILSNVLNCNIMRFFQTKKSEICFRILILVQ